MTITEWLLLSQTIIFLLTSVIVYFYTPETYKLITFKDIELEQLYVFSENLN